MSSAQHLKPDGSHCQGINHLCPGLICGEHRCHHAQLHSHVLIPPSTQAGHLCQDQVVVRTTTLLALAPIRRSCSAPVPCICRCLPKARAAPGSILEGRRSTLQGCSPPWLWTHGSNDGGMEQHPCMEPQSKLSPCASSPYFITEASYIWRFRRLGETQTLRATDCGLSWPTGSLGRRESSRCLAHQLTGSTGLPQWAIRG